MIISKTKKVNEPEYDTSKANPPIGTCPSMPATIHQ
jgi:hypothetical protein